MTCTNDAFEEVQREFEMWRGQQLRSEVMHVEICEPMHSPDYSIGVLYDCDPTFKPIVWAGSMAAHDVSGVIADCEVAGMPRSPSTSYRLFHIAERDM